MNITTTKELVDEFSLRALAAGLKVECPAAGTFNAELVIVAEAPGWKEVEGKLPLIGGAGQILWGVSAKKGGFSRSECYITNVSKRQMALSNNERSKMSKHERQQWIDLVRWELSQLPNVRYVVCLGNLALEAVTGNTGITKWRGSIMEVPWPLQTFNPVRSVTAICTYNPAMVAREPKTELPFTFDIAKVKQVRDGTYKPYIIEHRINPSFAEASDWIDKMRSERKAVSFDIEVISGETACVGLANDAYEGMCINWRTVDRNVYSTNEEVTLRRALQSLFLCEDVRFIAQNGMFDSTWLWFKDKIRVRPIWHDTMLAHHLLYPPLPHNLGFLTTQYTYHPFYKDEKKNWKEGGNIDAFWRYNVKDACITWKIAHSLESELIAQGLHRFFHDHVMRLQPHLTRMTVGGVLIDDQLRSEIEAQVSEDVQRALRTFYESAQRATGEQEYFPNPNSPKQMADLFFSRLKLVGRGTATDKENRKRIYNHPRTNDDARTMLDAIDNYSKEHKFYSTYVTTDIDDDKRMRCSWNQMGVQSAPGRLSSSATLWGSGTNLQNQPRRALPMYIADEGYTFVYFDMSQIEARIVGWLYNIESWIEQFERARVDGSYDAHRALASEMFNLPYDDVPASDVNADGSYSIRYTAKRCRHGLNYRMGPDRLATVLGVSLAEATRLWHIYHRTTPELRQGWSVTEAEVKKNRCLYNAYGRRWLLLERLSDEALEAIIAFYPQSTNGDHVCSVIYKAEEHDLWPKDAAMSMNVHDALIGLAPKDKAKTCLSIMKAYAEQPIMIKGRPLIVPAECKIGEPDEKGIIRWSTLKKVDIEPMKFVA